ncbi:MAG: GNAT family N-acetyltransferase [Candidatus Thiodiazotropha sp.]|jgi:[ribosomal protein S5]-alanine N-acetyltransferase
MKQPKLHTERLLLRPLTIDDGVRIRALAGNWAVAKTTLSIPHPYEEGMAEKWISDLEDKWKEKAGVSFGVELKKTNEIIGVVSLVSISHNSAEIGYWIGEQYWGNGYCTEASKSLIQFALKQLHITFFKAEHLTENPASGKVMVKLGLKHLLSVERLDRTGKPAQVETYAIDFT